MGYKRIENLFVQSQLLGAGLPNKNDLLSYTIVKALLVFCEVSLFEIQTLGGGTG